MWQQTLGMTTITPEASGVPEPASGMSMLAAMASTVRNRRRNASHSPFFSHAFCLMAPLKMLFS